MARTEVVNRWQRMALDAREISVSGVASLLAVTGTTTNSTPTELLASGSRLVIPNDSTWTFSALVVARRTDANGESAGYRLEGCIDRNAGTVALVAGVFVTELAEDQAGWDLTATADDTNKALVFTATGENSKTIKWAGNVSLARVTG